jgi:hypothetical protein
MKNRTEQMNLLFTRVAEALSSKEFRKQLVHHTDLDIAKIQRIGGATWITLKDGSYFKLMSYISRSPYKVDPETGGKVSLDPEDPRNGGKKDLSETTRWRVSFEVDLKGLIPKESDLQPHDYPLLAWAQQAIFDTLFNHSLCAALAAKTNYLEQTPEHQAMRDYLDEKVDVAHQANTTFKMEQITETNG